MIALEKIKKLPDSPGVYLFKGQNGAILYVGKATSLRSRVRSYFLGNILETRGALVQKMVEIASRVDFIQTDSVLEALILEASLIKKHQPPHNTRDKDDKSFNQVVITTERFPRVLLVRGRDVEREFSDPASYLAIYGPFPNGGALREAMKIIRRIFPYRDKCIPAEELPQDATPRPCFNSQIGLCPGVCAGTISVKEYRKIINHLMLFFGGQKKKLLSSLEKEMKAYAKNKEFEKAAAIKKTVFALQHIQDVALIRRDKNTVYTSEHNRIEAYDIAHLAGSSTVGVMTVVENAAATPDQYRMFRIRQDSRGDDLKALEEVLRRRFAHPEWAQPFIVVIDGGPTQFALANKVISELKINTHIVSVVKDKAHKPREILGDEAIIAHHRPEIILANAEAHRFAIKYHKNLRGRNFLQGNSRGNL